MSVESLHQTKTTYMISEGSSFIIRTQSRSGWSFFIYSMMKKSLFFCLFILALRNCEGKNKNKIGTNGPKHYKKTADIEKKIVKMDNRLVNIEAMMQKLLEQNHNTVNITNEIPLLQRVMKQSPESCQTQEMQMCRMIICKIWNISIDKMTKNDCERRCKSLSSKNYKPS